MVVLAGCGAKTSGETSREDSGITDSGVTDSGVSSCALAERWSYAFLGGKVSHQDTVELVPPLSYRITRTDFRTTVQCEVEIADCQDTTAETNIATLTAALSHPDVLNALTQAKPPLYGLDMRPSDGQVFQLLRADGRGFLQGEYCEGHNPPCVQIPAGVAAASGVLSRLRQNVLTSDACAALVLMQ